MDDHASGGEETEDLETSQDRSRIRRHVMNARLLRLVDNLHLALDESDRLPDRSKNTLLHLCGYRLQYQHAAVEICEFLGKSGYSARNVHGELALHIAAKHGNYGVLQVLLEFGKREFSGEEMTKLLATREWRERMSTPLHHAVRFGSPKCVSLLLEAGKFSNLNFGAVFN